MLGFDGEYIMLFKPKKFTLVVLVLLLVQTWWMMAVVLSIPQDSGSTIWMITADVGQYFAKAHAVLDGTTPFHLMPLEYPIAAFLLMALPALLASTVDQYLAPFMVEIMIWNAVLFFMVVRWVRRERGEQAATRSASWYTLWMMIFTPMWALRIDVPAAMLIFASFTWLISRPGWAAALGVIGGYMKLVPLVTVLAAVRQRRSIKTLLVAAGTFLLILLLWWMVGRPSLEYAVNYHLQRGIEIGSLYSGIIYLAGKIAHWSMVAKSNFASIEIHSPISAGALSIVPFIQLTAILWPLFRLQTGTNVLNWRLVAAMVLGYMIFGKVLSPQYLIWLIPLYAVVTGPQAKKQQLIFTAACIATIILYPWCFLSLVGLSPAMFIILNVRNALLIWLYWLAVRPENDTSISPTTIFNKSPNKEKPTIPDANQPNSAMVY